MEESIGQELNPEVHLNLQEQRQNDNFMKTRIVCD